MKLFSTQPTQRLPENNAGRKITRDDFDCVIDHVKKMSGAPLFYEVDVVVLSIGDYAGIRQEYRARLYAEIAEFLSTSANQRTKANAAKRAANEAFTAAGDLGYVDGGGTLPMDGDNLKWLNARTTAELANIDALFSQLAETRKDPEFVKSEASDIAETRADGYMATLDSVYNESKVRGAVNLMLTFGGQDGHAPNFPCRTCAKLKGQRHRASWWIKRGLIPYPGNTNFSCGAWQCRHFLFTDKGDLFTI